MNDNTIELMYRRAYGTVTNPSLPADDSDELSEQLADVEEEMLLILHGDIGEWVSDFYREEYRDHQVAERDEPLCDCANPRCRLKHGELPRPLRKSQRQVFGDSETGEERLQSYLKRHPEARVIDEALDSLVKRKRDIMTRLRDIRSDAKRRREAAEADETDDTDRAGVHG